MGLVRKWRGEEGKGHMVLILLPCIFARPLFRKILEALQVGKEGALNPDPGIATIDEDLLVSYTAAVRTESQSADPPARDQYYKKIKSRLQVGSYVPAASMRLRAIDAVHTRMGASDNLAQVLSHFIYTVMMRQMERSIKSSDAACLAHFHKFKLEV